MSKRSAKNTNPWKEEVRDIDASTCVSCVDDEDQSEKEIDDSQDNQNFQTVTPGKREAVSDSGCSREMDESSSKRQKLQKKPWTSSEMNSIHKHFSHFITILKVPGKNDVTNVLKKDKNLSKRTWRNVRDQVYNLIKKQRKC
ncbi:uncharacterized protein LOC125658100 [Ostrea edulis]|uniref:uncharacterized protein LOC125658100 n=1 Tax=Ostrea edulis TaxID=37623 RepID=UPI0024AF2788|nr:uncharacterized protein LOC125658100 [Ostrea edulis]